MSILTSKETMAYMNRALEAAFTKPVRSGGVK
jgi:hypothetical protein